MKKNITSLFQITARNLNLNFLVFFAILLLSQTSVSQIVADGLNNSSSLFTISGGAYYSGNSAFGDRPSSSPFASEGTHSYGVTNATAILTSSAISTTNYTGIAMTLRLAAFSITNATNGVDGTDLVTVEISPNGGANWYSTLTVSGPSAANAYWSYSTGTGNAMTPYDGNNTPVAFAPAATGSRTTDGYSTITITSLPAVNNLRVRITLLNNDVKERWLVDDFKITGTLTGPPEIEIQGNGVNIASGDNTPSTSDNTDFGSQLVSSGTVSKTYTINNIGTGGLTVGAISFSGSGAADYSVTTAPAATVPNGGNTTFTVTFDPSAAGTRNAAISIVNNDSDENPYIFALKGIGLADTNVPDYVNLQYPFSVTIDEGSTATIYAQVFESGVTEIGGQGANITGWIGYSSTNTNPNGGGWTWIPATYFGDSFANDQYIIQLGTGIAPGAYFYASRFQIGAGPYKYGGQDGEWNSNSGILTVNSNLVDYVKIQYPFSENILEGTSITVYTQVYEPGITDPAGDSGLITAWIGYSVTNSNPNTGSWTWIPAPFNVQDGNNYEYSAEIGGSLLQGTYYYASRVRKSGSSQFRYGGTGGIWNNDSGVLTITGPQHINLQGNGITIVNGDTTTSIANGTDFGSVALGETVVKTFTIQNTGGIELLLDSAIIIEMSNGFTITQEPADMIAPGGFTTFEVTFTPTEIAEETNNFYIQSNDPNESPYVFAVRGEGALPLPIATAATDILQNSFSANWDALDGAFGYYLDVATGPDFGGPYANVVSWDFPLNPDDAIADGGIAANAAKTISVSTGVGAIAFGVNGASSKSASATDWNSGSGTKYWEVEFTTLGHYGVRVSSKQRSSNTGPRNFKLQYKIGSGGAYADVSGGAVVVANNFTSGVLSSLALPTSCDNQSSVFLRWIMTSNTNVNGAFVPTGGVTNIDDILVEGTTSAFVTGYNNLDVFDVTSYNVVGLNPNTTYYYRVRAYTDATSGNSNTITVLTQPASVIWDGSVWSNTIGPDVNTEATIAGVFNSAINSEFSAKKLTINSGSFTIAAGTNITVVDEVINNLTDADFVIESNGNLIQTNDVNNIGNATVLRSSNPLKRLDYVLWSSPVNNQNLLAFSNQTLPNRFYEYNPDSNLYSNITPSTNPFGEGKGYLIRMPDNHPTAPTAFNGIFKGNLHNGDVNIGVGNGTYNAIGNPYPSTIDADLFIGQNNITEALYFWRKTNNAQTTSYATYTLAGGTGTQANTGDPAGLIPNGIIQVGQGFIAKATSTTLSFNNGMRVANNDNQFFRSNIERNRIWLNLTNTSGVFSQTMVAYMSGATQGVDAAIDGLYFNDSQLALNSLIGNAEYAIQGRALPFDNSDSVPLGFKAITAGNYTVSIDHADGLFDNAVQDIFLKDNVLNIMHDLRAGSYTFAAEAGTSNSRFEIVYQTQLGISNPVLEENPVVVYKQGQDIVINAGLKKMAKVQIYDLRGRLLIQKNDINATEIKLFAGDTPQVLILKILNQNGATYTRKVIN